MRAGKRSGKPMLELGEHRMDRSWQAGPVMGAAQTASTGLQRQGMLP